MATHNFYIANPTASDVTVDSITVKAGQVAKANLSDATTDLYGFVDAGCAVASADATTTVDSNTQLAEKGAHLLESMIRAVESAGADTHGQAGL